MSSGYFKIGLKIGSGFFVAVLAFGFVTVLFAQAVKRFTAGQTVSASEMNANFDIAAPTGLIAAFYLSSCPSGWIVADGTNGTPDLRGRFIRALDNMGTGAAGNDPDGTRSLGAVQADAFQGHHHGHSMWSNYGSLSGPSGMLDSTSGTSSGTVNITDPTNDGTNGAPRTASETRPKNVALRFCMRKDT